MFLIRPFKIVSFFSLRSVLILSLRIFFFADRMIGIRGILAYLSSEMQLQPFYIFLQFVYGEFI